MKKSLETIQVKHEEPLTWVILDRPEYSNAFNTKMAEEMLLVFEGLISKDFKTRCVILTGSGDKAFCAGGDLKQRNGMSDEQWFDQHEVFEELARLLMKFPLPVIGAINGAAFGGGLELTLACDFAYAASHARFALPETSLGIIPGMAGTQYLPRAVGAMRAKEIILTGSPFSAQQAYDWGIVNEVFEGDKLMGAVKSVAERIAKNAPISIENALKSINHARFADLNRDYQFELDCYKTTISSKDRREGVSAFNEKRRPNFTGK